MGKTNFMSAPKSSASNADRIALSQIFGSLLLYGTFGLLLFGPLAFGAVEPWSIFVLEAGAALLLLLWTVRQAASGELSVTGNPLFAPVVVFARLIGLQLVTGRTAYRYESISSALLYCAYGMVCFLVAQV